MRLLSMSLTFKCVNSAFRHSGGVERHQQNAMVGSERRIDELRDFFLAQDRRKVKCSFRIGSLGDAPGLLESLGVEEPQSRQTDR